MESHNISELNQRVSLLILYIKDMCITNVFGKIEVHKEARYSSFFIMKVSVFEGFFFRRGYCI